METVDSSRVLVVDDEPQITRVLKTVLSSQGYQVRTAAEGESALTNFKEWSPELVITDLYMPHMDGVAFLQEAMKIFPEAKRALLTAYADTNAAIGAINQASINFFFLIRP